MASFTRGRPCFSPARSLELVDRRASRRRRRGARRARRAARRRPPRSRSLRGSARADVLEQQLDRLGRVLLVRADDAGRPALDPAGRVDARLRRGRPRCGSSPVARRTGRRGRRRRGSRRCGSTSPHGSVSRSSGRDTRAVVCVRAVAHELDRLDAIRRRGSRPGSAKKRSTTRFGLPARLARRELAQHLDVALATCRRRVPLGALEIGRDRRSRRRRRARRAPRAPAS